MKDLVESRAKQAADKLKRQELLREDERRELSMQLEHTRRMDEREATEAKRKHDKVLEFRRTLQSQIEELEALRARQRSGHDGPTIREELIREEERLKVVRDRMVRDLEAQGVNPKYLSEMRNVDIGKLIRR